MPRSAPAVPRDPVLVEVVRNELEAMVDEMRIAVRRTGRSPMVKVGDFAVTLCDAAGRGIGVGPHNMMTSLFHRMAKRVVGAYGGTFEPGDVFIVNDPYAGGSHVPDVLVITPLFFAHEHVAFAVVYSHHTDMGGRFPGSMSGQAESAYEEGLHVPLVRLERKGSRNRALLDVIMANVRSSDDFLGDLEAKIAGTRKAAQQLEAILDKYGVTAFRQCCDHLNERAADAMRAAIGAIPAGTYTADVPLADDGVAPADGDPAIRVALRFDGETVTVDFAGTCPQVRGALNIPFENVNGVAISTLAELLAPGVPLNDGLASAITVTSPPGLMTNPTFPAATSGRTSRFVDEVIHRALSKAAPDRVPAPREGWDVMHFSGHTDAGGVRTLTDMFSGGWGARPDGDGIDGVAQTPTVTLPAELIEREFPIVVEGFGFVADTAGAGRFRGSLAVFRRFRFTGEGAVMIRTNRVRPAPGFFGGAAGTVGFSEHTSDGTTTVLEPASYTHLRCRAGDVLYHQVAGAAGLGDPFERDPSLVLEDVRQERMTVAAAREQYGVVVVGQEGELTADRDATRLLRDARRKMPDVGVGPV